MKLFKNKLAVAIIVLSVTFLSVIIFSVKRNGIVAVGISGSALNPVQKVMFTINSKIKNEIQYIFGFLDIRKENNSLKEENIKLQNELVEYSTLKSENEEFRKILEFKNQRSEYNYIGANIIGISGGDYLNGYIIDKGKDSNLAKDMIIICGDGLVGKITEVHSNWSKIETLINENIAVAGKVVSTQDNGIVKGYRNNKGIDMAKIEQLPIESEIKAGDIITTSILGRCYPDGIRIGEVIDVQEDKVKVMKTAIIKPYVNYDKLQSIFVVVPKDIKNITEDGVKY